MQIFAAERECEATACIQREHKQLLIRRDLKIQRNLHIYYSLPTLPERRPPTYRWQTSTLLSTTELE